MTTLEVNKEILGKLEAMGFSEARATRALQCSGNTSLEAAVNWTIDHENDSDVDQILPGSVNIDLNSPKSFHITEKMRLKAQELRDQARKRREEEEEEKKLEKAREKERRQIAEEIERKRNLALRKAEKEEEKRAKEKVRKKLEEDKAERRSKLGLPKESIAVPKPSGPGVPDKKKTPWPVKSPTKAEQMRECLRSLRCNLKDDDARAKRAFQTLLIYVGNVVRSPNEEKFRKIRLGNPIFHERIGSWKGGIEFLELCGFQKIEENKYLFLPLEMVDTEVLKSAGSEVKSAMENPFFGKLSYGHSQ